VRVERRARRPGVLAHEFQVAERRDERDGEREQERQPEGSADLSGHGAGERVDARTQDVADHEEQQQARTYRPLQLGRAPGRILVRFDR
jgi:hypothetical protein